MLANHSCMPRVPRTSLLSCLLACLALALPAQQARPPERFQLAVGLQQRGLHEEAARAFAAFLQQEPQHALAAEASYRLGSCYVELGDRKAAAKALAAALQLATASFAYAAECRYRLGHVHKEDGELAAAAAQFTALADSVDASHYLLAPARYAEGECWRDLHDDARALAAFEAAAAGASGDAASFLFPALYQAGFAALRQGRFESAAALFTQAADAAGADGKAECRYLAGDALLRAQQWEPAATAYRQALSPPGPFTDDARFGLGLVAVQQGDQAAALREFGLLLEQHADSPLADRARLEVGRLHYLGQRFPDCERAVAPLLQDAATAELRQPARELAGLAALGRGDAAIAATLLQQALPGASPADAPRLWFALGEALAALRRFDEALAAYRSVPDDSPHELRGDALYGACFALHQLGRHQESNAAAQALQALAPRHRLHDQATFALAENLFAQRDYAAAAPHYDALLQVTALAPKARWKLAWCRYLTGDKQAAATQFAALADDEQQPFREEACSMVALCRFELGDGAAALRAADTYAVRYPQGSFTDRTERIAARVLQQQGDLDGAGRRLARAEAAGSAAAVPATRLEQAELLFQRGDYQRARQLYNDLAGEAGAIGAQAIEGLAWCAFELGDDAACAQQIERGLAHPAIGERKATLLELQVALHHRRQQWPQAIAAGEAFLGAYPQHPQAKAQRHALGVAHARAGDDAAARAVLEPLAKEGGPARIDRTWYELAWACRRLGDEPAALAAFAQVAVTAGDEDLRGEANLHLGTAALATGEPARGRELLEAVQGRHRGRALYQLGCHELEVGKTAPERLRAAAAAFASVASLPDEPLAPEACFLSGDCALRQDDVAGAAAMFRTLLGSWPAHERAPAARLALGECAVRQQRPDEAIEALQALLQQPAAPAVEARAQLWLGRARLLRREHPAAEAAFSRVTELSEGSLAAEAQYRLGESRAQRGAHAEAADAFVKLSILYDDDRFVPLGLLGAGGAYEALQQPQKAQRFYDECARRFPDSEPGRQAAQRLRKQ